MSDTESRTPSPIHLVRDDSILPIFHTDSLDDIQPHWTHYNPKYTGNNYEYFNGKQVIHLPPGNYLLTNKSNIAVCIHSSIFL